ncbi:MAG: DNA/RNA non-specific endonuclease [Treponema sp.]|nr:DNA/RNA non-specific endonuclease [Candidatus Treponema equifaecale]
MKRVLSILLLCLPFFASAQTLPVAADKTSYPIQNKAYSVGFSELYGLPIWSVYTYSPEMKKGIPSAAGEWTTDTRIKANRSTAKDFDAFNLNKTQLFPKEHAISSAEAYKSTYLTSNILPMSAALKEHIWDRITDEIEDIGAKTGSVQVYSGPIFEQEFSKNRFLFGNRVSKPIAFYRILIYQDEGKWIFKCYKFPNRAPSDYEKVCDLKEFNYNLYQLEAETGIDFLNQNMDANFRKQKMEYLQNHINN